MNSRLIQQCAAAIVGLFVTATVVAEPVVISVPELVFNGGAEVIQDAPAGPAASAAPTTIHVPGLVFRGGEESMAGAGSAGAAQAPTLIRVPGLVFQGGDETNASRDAGAPARDSGGPLVIRTAELRFDTGVAADGRDASGNMSYATFDSGPVSGTFLQSDAATVSIEGNAEIRYRGLPVEGRHRLRAWLVSEASPRIYREQSTSEGEKSGTWRPALAIAGDYLICIVLATNTAKTRRSPDNADECVAVTAVWGDPSDPPRPVIETSPFEPVVGRDFELTYRGMPAEANAKIFVYKAGTPSSSNAAADVVTRGKTSGSGRVRIYDAGDYDIRIIYERLGRQIRATRSLRVVPEFEEISR